MAIIPAGTKFIGINPDINTEERRSALSNSYQEFFSIEDFETGLKTVSVDGITINGDGTEKVPLSAVYQPPAVDGVTITGDGTLGNPLVALGGGGGTVNYANVIFVDSTNGNDGTGSANDFSKPYASIDYALTIAAGLSPNYYNRALIYVRKGLYSVGPQYAPTTLVDYADFYCEVGCVLQGGYGRISDQGSPAAVNVNFMGYAELNL
jgi:hypothetical protein